VGVGVGLGFVGVGAGEGADVEPGVLPEEVVAPEVDVLVEAVEPLPLVVVAELFDASFEVAAPQPVINKSASSAIKEVPSRVI
jgi:hypothetical protein